MTNRFSILLLAACLCACSVVDDAKLNEVRAHAMRDLGGPDMGPQPDLGPVDGGPDTGVVMPADLGPDLGPPPDMGPVGAERCADTTGRLLIGNEAPFVVDTTQAAADFSPSCALPNRTITANGRDRFFRFEAAAGEYWHFHIAVDPTLPAAEQMNLDPVVYVVDSTCNTRGATCNAVSDVCGGSPGDEHFPFIAPIAGTYWVGVDDARSTTGGRYILAVYKPMCGNSNAEHGEGCDTGATCSTDCRQILGMTAEGPRSSEAEFNDNRVEANLVEFASMTTLDITGRIGSGGDCYPDVFRVQVPMSGNLSVVAHPMAGGNCNTAFNDAVDLSVTNMAEQDRGTVDTDPTSGCPRVTASSLPQGGYLVWMRAAMQSTSGTAYRLTFTR